MKTIRHLSLLNSKSFEKAKKKKKNNSLFLVQFFYEEVEVIRQI